LSQDEARRIDEELMGPEVGFSIDQLIELAGMFASESDPVAKKNRKMFH
jgi:hypothetical protein